MMPLTIALVRRVEERLLREGRGSQAKLARRLCVHSNVIASWLRLKNAPGCENTLLLLEWLEGERGGRRENAT
jgi:hypothetical protein